MWMENFSKYRSTHNHTGKKDNILWYVYCRELEYVFNGSDTVTVKIEMCI